MLKTFAAALIATSMIAGSALAAEPAANAATNPPAVTSHMQKPAKMNTAKHAHKNLRKHARKHYRGKAHKAHKTHIRKSDKAS